MFTVPKSELPTYWWACNGHVEERVGEMPDEGYYDNYSDAYVVALKGKRDSLERDLKYLQQANAEFAMKIYRIRAWWNPRIRKAIKRIDAKLKEAETAYHSSISVVVKRVPDSIPVLGDRIAIGTRVYEFDSFSLKLHVATVESEHIRYYDFHPEGVPAIYRLSNGRSVKSDLSSGFSNIEHYLDSDAANTRMCAAVEARIEELQEQLR